MTSLVLLLLLQTAPATPPPAQTPVTPPAAAAPAPPPAEPQSSPADTLAGLQETYRQTCGQTGILYYSYAELCDTLRKQIHEYEDKLDRDARQARKAQPPKP